MLHLAFFPQNSKPCGKFSHFRTKNTIVWESLRKFWQFLMKNQLKHCVFIDFLGNFVAKNRTFANNIMFLQEFFPVRGGVTSPHPSPFRDCRKNTVMGNFEKNFENCEQFSPKIAKMHYFRIFFKKFNKALVSFLRIWTNRKLILKFEKIFENIENFSSENCENPLFYHIFQRHLTNHA